MVRIAQYFFCAVLFLALNLHPALALQLPSWDYTEPPEKPQEHPQENSNNTNPEVYRAGVKVIKQLPEGMYGMWSIQARVTKTDHPSMNNLSTEIWELARDNHVVTIENVVNQAKASITVDEATENSASFHREFTTPNGRLKIIEQPSVTVDGNFIRGTNKQTYIYLRNGQVTKEYHLEAEITGTRLALEAYKFKVNSAPDFDIPDIEIQPDY